MNKDEALKTKFVELSKRFELVYNEKILERTRKYIQSVGFSKLYKAKLKTDLGFEDYFNSDDSKVWGYDECPLFMTCNLLSLYIDYRVITTYTLDNKKSYTKKAWVESTLEDQTENYEGDAKLKVEEGIKQINKDKFKQVRYNDNLTEGYLIYYDNRTSKKRTIKNFNDYSEGAYPEYKKSIVDGYTVYTSSYDKKEQVYDRVYILQYKGIWCKITEEEKDNLLEDISDVRNKEVLSELMNLDINSIDTKQRF